MKLNAQSASLRIRKPRSLQNALNLVPLKHDLDILTSDVDEVRRAGALVSHEYLSCGAWRRDELVHNEDCD